MTRLEERDHFIAAMAREGVPVHVAREIIAATKILRRARMLEPSRPPRSRRVPRLHAHARPLPLR